MRRTSNFLSISEKNLLRTMFLGSRLSSSGTRTLFFFKERLGLKLAHKRITTKVVLPVSRVRVLYRGSYKGPYIVTRTGGGGQWRNGEFDK